MTSELIKQTYLRSGRTDKAEFFSGVYDIMIKLLEGFNYAEVEEFLEYSKEMAKITSTPKVHIEGGHGINYKPPYETNMDKMLAMKKGIWI
jgi:hypothetical protein